MSNFRLLHSRCEEGVRKQQGRQKPQQNGRRNDNKTGGETKTIGFELTH